MVIKKYKYFKICILAFFLFIFSFIVLFFKWKTEYTVHFLIYEDDKFDIQYPQLKFVFDKKEEKKINQLIYEHMKGPLGSNPNMCIGLSAEIMYQDDHFVSISYKGFSYDQSGWGFSNYGFAINIDISNNQIFPISYLINEKDFNQLKEQIANKDFVVKFGYRNIENNDEYKLNKEIPDINDVYSYYIKDGFIGIIINSFDEEDGNFIKLEIPYNTQLIKACKT